MLYIVSVENVGSNPTSHPYLRSIMRYVYSNEIERVYHNSYYDYPRAGVLKLDNKRYYYKELEYDSELLYIFDLTDEEWAEEDQRRQAWLSMDWDDYHKLYTEPREYVYENPVAIWDRRYACAWNADDSKNISAYPISKEQFSINLEWYDEKHSVAQDIEFFFTNNEWHLKQAEKLSAALTTWIGKARGE